MFMWEFNVVVMPVRCYKANVFNDVKCAGFVEGFFYRSNYYVREAEFFVTTTGITGIICISAFKFGQD